MTEKFEFNKVLTHDKLTTRMTYLNYLVDEALRIDSPEYTSPIYEAKENLNLGHL